MDSLPLFSYKTNTESQQTASAAIGISLFTTITTEKSTLFSSNFKTIMDYCGREYDSIWLLLKNFKKKSNIVYLPWQEPSSSS